MIVSYQDLEINQGATHMFEVLIYEDEAQTQLADLTGFTAKSQIRKSYTTTDVAAEMACYIGPATTLGQDSGLHAISLTLTSAVTIGMIEHDYVYDVEISKPGVVDSNGDHEPPFVIRVLEGKIYVNPVVTRPTS